MNPLKIPVNIIYFNRYMLFIAIYSYCLDVIIIISLVIIIINHNNLFDSNYFMFH